MVLDYLIFFIALLFAYFGALPILTAVLGALAVCALVRVIRGERP